MTKIHATNLSRTLRLLSTTSKFKHHGSIPLLRSKSTAETTQKIQLKTVPMLPFFGSLIPQYSGIPRFDIRKVYEFFPAIHKQYGDFFTIGLPNVGVGIYGKLHILSDPDEMHKVFRNEGPYPHGVIQSNWPNIKFFNERNSSLVGLFGQGEEWKRLRTFLQTDLLSPKAAKGYVPGMVRAAAMASKGAPEASHDMKNYLSKCSFDMFSTIMFGELVHTANDRSQSAAEDQILCEAVLGSGEGLVAMIFSPRETLLNKVGMDSARYRSMSTYLSTAMDIANRKIEEFKNRKINGTLTDLEKSSYLARAMDRQEQEKSVSEKEMTELCMIVLLAAVDTTSSFLHWVLVHLALNPQVQQTLADELQRNITNGILCEEALNRKNVPYLHAVIRETHRLTPALMGSMTKTTSSQIEIHGTTFPAGSMFRLDAYSKQTDPEIVPNARTFDPNRWLEDAVNARKGTPSQVIDHPFFRDPFSHGARKCPGSRVANYELLVMISQLVLDWSFSISDDGVKSLDDVQYVLQLTIRPENHKFQFSPRV